MGIHSFVRHVAAALVVCNHRIEEKKPLLMMQRSVVLDFSSAVFTCETPAFTAAETGSVIAEFESLRLANW